MPSDQTSEDLESFLIPTASTQQTRSNNATTELTSKTGIINLRPISSNFYRLPVRRKDQEPRDIYISPRASFPTITTPGDTHQDLRTLFLTNLEHGTSVEMLKNLFSEALGVEISEIEALIQIPQDRSNGFSRLNLAQRESGSNSSSSRSTLNKRPKRSSNDSKKDLIIPALVPEPAAASSPLIITDLLIARHLPNGYVRFKTPEQLQQVLRLDPSRLPLDWPISQKLSSISWLDRRRTHRDSSRPSSDCIKAHTDAWMIAHDAGLITPLESVLGQLKEVKSTNQSDDVLIIDPKISTTKGDHKEEEDGDDGWTTVVRGGHHGRSSTIPTQTNQRLSGPDPYAQSSMAGRDEGAAVKVMKRGFAEAFSSSSNLEAHQGRKRKGGELNTSFYRINTIENKQAKFNELKRKFEEDKARVERMRNSRKFRPY